MAKKRSGQQTVNNVKSSNFLPTVFQTELNKSWLDSTLDQMVSKGPLENIDGYIGSRNGKVSLASDDYLETKETKSQLKPAVVSYNKQKELTNAITFDDIANSINTNFSTYNYNAAYASDRYSFNPPINIDKFVNYTNYRWVEELPVYESIWTGSAKNPITDIQTNGKSQLVDDNNTFTVENNMLIKFTGSGWNASVLNKTYIVAGSAGKHKLYEYIDENGVRVYNNTVKHSENNDGVWHNNVLFNAELNTNYNGYNAGTVESPEQLVTHYNNTNPRLPFFDGFNFPQLTSNPTQLISDMLVKFTGSWVHSGITNSTDIFSITINATTGDIAITAATAAQIISANETLSPDNNLMYDEGNAVTPQKDYIVITKDDPFQTAWSRANHWVNISTINKLVDLIPTYDFTEIKNIKRKAQRPIIEYNAGINLWNQAEHTGVQYLGAVHGLAQADAKPTTVGDKYLYIDNSDYKLYTVASGTDTSVDLTDNDTFSIKSTLHTSWVEADGYCIDGTITLAQQKTKINQYPLYKFYNMEGESLEGGCGKSFTGDKIFGYKVGTGTNDTELGFPLSFKDTPKGAEYEFENFILTNKYYTNHSNAEYSKATYSKDQIGYNLFKQNNVLKTIYTPAGNIAGAFENAQYKIEAIDAPLTIPYGYNNWRPTSTYLIHNIDNDVSITIAHDNGTTHTTRTGNAELYTVGENQTVVFENLTGLALTVVSYGVDIESTSIPEISFARSGQKITLVTSASSNNTHFDIVAGGTTVLQSFIVTQQWDNSFYKLTVNGNNIEPAKVTIGATTVTIDESAFAINDLVDFSWRNNDLANKTTNISLPDVHIHNANNTAIETFTMSETINHWTDKLNAMPGFDGNMLGDNNFASIPHTTHHGGTIFMHENISAMHDINYSNNNLTITGALVEQGKEFDAFRTRVGAQARRLYTLGTTTIQALTDSAITEILRNKQKSKLYNTSNMLYTDLINKHEFDLEDADPANFTKTFKTRFTFNGDTNIRDHVYVYLTENNGSNVQVRKLLLKDRDYTFLSDTVTLNVTYAALDTAKTAPKVEVYHIKMDEESYVPPSMVKLGLAYGVEPQVHGNILYTHDGKQIDVTGKDIENIGAGATFDPVNAVIFEMEKRIYAGLVKEDAMYNDESEGVDRFNSPVEYIPTEHVGTWFKLNDLNNYVEKHYYKWARLNKITSLNTANYYDAADPFTWNYSTITISGHFTGNTLPGHWKGAYTHLFGTCTPHITPWHMLGYAFKPTWWDANYSWTDATKRTALLNALSKGIISNPSSNTTQVIRNARHSWDFTTKCPVKADGTLEDPSTVLGMPANIDKEKEFVFGDWGPVEAQWRLSAFGQSMMLDAVLKLNPAKAWTDFFQPGVIGKHNAIIRNTNHYNKLLPATGDYKIPGKIYENSIESLTLNSNSSNTLEKTGYFNILDDSKSTIARARYRLTVPSASTGTAEVLSLIERGLDFTGQPIVSYVGSDSVLNPIDVAIKLKQVPFTANGIAQAQYNYIIRNSIDVSLEDLYKNLTTKLQAKLNGFTSKHLINVSAETSAVGDFELGIADFNVSMYEGSVTELVTASLLVITKTLTGYKVAGINNNTREFKFYEPNLVSPTDYTTQTIAGQTVRRYNKFVTTPSIVEYDAEFEKLQDMYNFIRGYWNWMETSGYTPAYDGDSSASDFVTWALRAEVNNGYILQIGREIKFKPTSGHVYEYNQLEYNSNDILLTDSTRIENSKLGIKRADGTTSIETKNKEFIGSVTSAVLDYEHIIIFENKTALGVNIFDDVKNNSQERLRLKGQRTQNWTGEKKAPGYLVFNDSIVQNFDSAVQSIDDMYRTDVDHFNESFSKAKDLTIGNVEGLLLDNLGINKNVLTNYHQGMIKEKGTKGAVEHIGKSDILHNSETKVSAYEQYMFRQSHLGNDDFDNALEIEIVSSDVNSSPQVITLDKTSTDSNVIVATSDKIVNDKSITFDTLSYEDSNSDILTGGEALATETKYRVLNSTKLSSVFDSTADYAIIPTWSPIVSYKKGDQVRFRGELWKCNTNFTGLDVVAPAIEVTTPLATDQQILTYGTVANIAGTTVTIEKTNLAYNDIVATGSSFTPFLESETLSIAGETITFNKQESIPTVIGPAVILGEAGPVSFTDVTGKSITINIRHGTNGDSNTVIDFDTTPANVVENFTGDGTTTQFTIAQTMSGATYMVDSITVNGVTQNVTTDYTQNLQIITFVNAPANSAAIVITLVHTPHQMSSTQIRDRINSYGIANLTASLETAGTIEVLQLSYQDTDVENELVLEAGSTNNDLGFITTPINQQIVKAQPQQGVLTPTNLTVEEVRDQINNTSVLPTNITATVASGNIVLTDTTGSTPLLISGTARTKLGLDASYPVSTYSANRSATYSEAVADIQAALTAASITDVSIVVIGNAIKITSTAASLTLGDTTFNSQTGLQTGTIYAAEGNIDNIWDSDHASYFDAITADPALYNILVADDSDFEITSSGAVQTKFWGWNVLQVTQRRQDVSGVLTTTPLYSLPSAAKNAASSNPTTCGICAGTSSKDGNDAEITTNLPHGLQVGDWVQLLNTDTTPNIDGIHKVTKVDANDNQIFYIDEYIEHCGNAVSIMPLVTTRFTNIDQRDGDGTVTYNNITGAESLARWNIPTDAYTFLSYVDAVRGTYVYKKGTTLATRINKTRPTNKDIDSVVIYNHKENKSKVQLEVWDPMRKIIPGIAQQNLDYINFSDNAIYTTSTDTNHLVDLDNAWGEEQIGTRWWDISKARYYDYDQGGSVNKTAAWGYLYPGAEIVVWEWIKSSVAPDDYADAVTNLTEMFGTIATGEAYSVYDNVAKETLYYYTTEKEYNRQTGSYNDVYYYWVKDKTTMSDTRTLSAYDVASMIENPTASGVSWFAVISENEIIIDNINYYIEDKNTVLQINKAGNKFNSHNEWMLIAKDSDLIPEYYINAMKRNFAGRDGSKTPLPYSTLHKFNRYGDDMTIGQTWFNNLSDARRNAIVTLNTQLKNINLNDEFEHTWDRTFITNNFPTLLWNWVDYELKSYTGTLNHTTTITIYSDLDTIDKDYHSVAKLNIFDNTDQLDRSEIYAYNESTSKWELVFKKNNTIKFDEALLSAVGGWDRNVWDSTPWDFADIAEYWETLLDALNNDIFVHYNKHQMNTFFFSVIHYVLSSMEQTTWVRKTTYIRLEFADAINTTTKKYTKSKINNVIGYVQEVKPFHTKSSTVLTKHTNLDEVGLTITEDPKTNITIKPQAYDGVFGGNTYAGASDWGTTYDDYITGEGTNIYSGPDFIAPELFNYTVDGHNRNSLVEISPLELLRINVQTNASGSTHATTSRTFAHVQDNNGYVNAYSLTEAKETTLTAALDLDDTTISVASTTAFDSVGIAYIGGELIEYVVADATTLGITKREIAGTFSVIASIGDSIINVTNSKLTFANDDPSHYQYNTLSDTILNSPGSTQAQELQSLGKGVEL